MLHVKASVHSQKYFKLSVWNEVTFINIRWTKAEQSVFVVSGIISVFLNASESAE